MAARARRPMLRLVLGFGLIGTFGVLADGPATEPLHRQIDRLVDAAHAGVTAPPASDGEFLRRLSLDFVGVTPTVSELVAFLGDPSPVKREAAIDRLLADPRFPRHFAQVLDVMWMERRAYQHVSAEQWQGYLAGSIAGNKPLNELIREILSADGVEDSKRPAARFYLDRGGEPNLITRDVGRMFFGRDLQCAQCHDSPLVDDYHQADYKGLYAIFEAGVLVTRKEGDKDKSFYGERAVGDVGFESVFVKGKRHVTAARVPGDAELIEAAFYPGEEYVTPPADGVVPVPKFSRRAKLAELATNGSNRAFNENLANRLWTHMLGRGLVHPVDMIHSGNPATHPDLLALLGRELATGGFQLKAFLKQIALSEPYQRSIDMPVRPSEAGPVAAERLAQMETTRAPLAATMEQSQSAYEAAREKHRVAEATLLPALDELNAARTAAADHEKKVAEAQRALADVQAALAQKQKGSAILAEALAKTKEASAQLPQDTVLSGAAQQLTDRSASLAAEMAADQKSIEEKSGLAQGLVAARGPLRSAMDSASAKVAPLREAVVAADREAVTLRAKSMEDVAQLTRLDERLTRLKEFLEYRRVEDELTATSTAVASAASAVESVRDKMADQALTIAEQQLAIRSSTEARSAGEQALAAAAKEKATRAESARLLAGAVLVAESARSSLMQDTGVTQVASFLKAESDRRQVELAGMDQEMVKASALVAEADGRLQSARQALEAALAATTEHYQGVQSARQMLADAQAKKQSVQSSETQAKENLTKVWASDFSLAELKPLTPEQICWSLLRITGIDERTLAGELAELEKASPLSEEAKKDPAQVRVRAELAEQKTFEKLKPNVSAFVAYFASAAGQPQSDFFATADQALFVANGGTVNGWLAPGGGNITQRLVESTDSTRAGEELYMTVLSRRPTDQEREDVRTYLERRPSDRAVAAQELVWALVTSAEFRFNH